MNLLHTIQIINPNEYNFVFGQSHFIKTIEDLYEIMIQCGGGKIKFGISFCEASGPRLIRSDGNDDELIKLSIQNAKNVGCGHTFFIFMNDGFPIQCLNAIKNCSEVCRIFCATANPTKVIIAEENDQRGCLGVLDGFKPLGVENDNDKKERQEFLQNIGYKR